MQNLFSVYYASPFNFGIWRKAMSLNQPKCDNVYPFHGKPVLYNTCCFWQTLNRKTNETKKWPRNKRDCHFKPFICGLTSMLGDILACLTYLRSTLICVCLLACLCLVCLLRTRIKSVCSVASRSWLFWKKKTSALSTTVVRRAMRYDALSSSLQSPWALWEQQPPSEWGQVRVCQTVC